METAVAVAVPATAATRAAAPVRAVMRVRRTRSSSMGARPVARHRPTVGLYTCWQQPFGSISRRRRAPPSVHRRRGASTGSAYARRMPKRRRTGPLPDVFETFAHRVDEADEV